MLRAILTTLLIFVVSGCTERTTIVQPTRFDSTYVERIAFNRYGIIALSPVDGTEVVRYPQEADNYLEWTLPLPPAPDTVFIPRTDTLYVPGPTVYCYPKTTHNDSYICQGVPR